MTKKSTAKTGAKTKKRTPNFSLADTAPREYKIEKGIPMPSVKRDGTRFPFDKMVVGDSFVVRAEDVSYARTAMKNYNRPLKQSGSNKRFVSRIQEDGTARIWLCETPN